MNEEKLENKNPKNNIGAIWIKEGTKGGYLLLKVTLDGVNHTLVAFPNSSKGGQKTSRIPDHYIFPFRPKESNSNTQEIK
jgi:hypothetical protein